MGVRNGPSDKHSAGLLHDAETLARSRFAGGSPSDHPHIQAWRSAYGGFGCKPSRFYCSAEALLRRALKDGIPPISRLVDMYNALSISYVVPIGGEDRDRLVGDVVLRFATGGEQFEARENGTLVCAPVETGEVVWIDGAGVTCRRWNWRQCARTALTND